MSNKKYLSCAGLSAYDLLGKLEISDIPVDPKDIAKKLEIEVDYDINLKDIKQEKEGLAFVENGIAKIWINPFLSENRKKFTLAHEIAHIINDIAPVLNKKKDSEIEPFKDDSTTLSFARSGISNLIEYSANEYAGRLLMPKDKVIEEAEKLLKNEIYESVFVEKLADKFKVSKSAMSIRLIRMGILD